MKIAFYKGNYKWYSVLIRWWTRGKYSHCEFYTDNGELLGISDDMNVRIKKQELNNANWDLYNLKGIVLNDIMPFFNANRGAKYDWKAILLSAFFNRKEQDNNKFTCSEFVANALDSKLNFIYPKWYSLISPNDLYKILIDKNMIERKGN